MNPPSSPSGEHLLAHEVTHTVQQQGGIKRLQLKAGDACETEAEQKEKVALVVETVVGYMLMPLDEGTGTRATS
jgi:hypothetical protein